MSKLSFFFVNSSSKASLPWWDAKCNSSSLFSLGPTKLDNSDNYFLLTGPKKSQNL